MSVCVTEQIKLQKISKRCRWIEVRREREPKMRKSIKKSGLGRGME